ncbi:DUF5320 domain-containing protein [bacterium]|jgi:hypothetical protein|nr:DUF5320 domain-containing protein [bacterium]MBT4649389.1 DUF5320 domain-containing protein [bacterium]
MPNRDKTGPLGKGPKTGRGIGLCDDDAKVQDDRPRRGLVRGQGIGRGLGLQANRRNNAK